MKKDSLQYRKLYRVAGYYAANQCEIIVIGADSRNLMVYHKVKREALEIFRNKYPNNPYLWVKVL